MNGALGYVRGYMLPEDFDPHSPESHRRSPLCVFVEFDAVNFGTDENGQTRSFFPDEPPADVPGSCRNWVPIFRQRVSSTVEERVWRENYPLQLAWALTHWKAQGMTLDRVRVHLTERTAGVPGIGFVACTRVRHPFDLVFEEDLPDYEHFMKVKKTPAFRERTRFELRQHANASRTLRKYGFCEADLWTVEESSIAEELLKGLGVTAHEQRGRLKHTVSRIDSDTWLWGDEEPDFVAELHGEIVRVAGDDPDRRRVCEHVASRLLDAARVRIATADETHIASELLQDGAFDTVRDMAAHVSSRVAELCNSDASKDRETYSAVASLVCRRLEYCGRWDGKVIDAVPSDCLPLHMSAVREALGALIPARLHRSLDAAVHKQRQDLGDVRGVSKLSMEGWGVSVRAEDALSQGSLQEEVLELFL